MKFIYALAVFLAASIALGCSVQQPGIAPPPPAQTVRPLPFKGKLVSGDPSQLPPAVAMSLSDKSQVGFLYREELTHSDYHIPLIITALDPVTYVGAPLGDHGVTAFASLSIIEGDRVLGNYTAKAFVSKSYSLYSEPTHMELEQAARTDVRRKIDDKLYRDADRLAHAIAAPGQSPTGPASE